MVFDGVARREKREHRHSITAYTTAGMEPVKLLSMICPCDTILHLSPLGHFCGVVCSEQIHRYRTDLLDRHRTHYIQASSTILVTIGEWSEWDYGRTCSFHRHWHAPHIVYRSTITTHINTCTPQYHTWPRPWGIVLEIGLINFKWNQVRWVCW